MFKDLKDTPNMSSATALAGFETLLTQVTISLLEDAMLKGGKQQVLIDGFPRNEENRSAFESQV